METNILKWIDRLKLAQHLSEVHDICVDLSGNLGMDYYSFTLCVPQSIVSPKVTVIHNYPKSWEKEYREQEYFSIDPIFAYATMFNTPVKWSDILDMDMINSPDSRVVITNAKKHGINEGLTIPTHTSNGTLGIFCLSTRLDGDPADKLIKAVVPWAQPLCIYICDALQRCLRNEMQNGDNGMVTKPQVTKREKECLLWASEGKTAWEISKILGISERTVLFHLNNCAKKFGAVNRQHAIAKAIMLGVIKPVIAFDEDTLPR